MSAEAATANDHDLLPQALGLLLRRLAKRNQIADVDAAAALECEKKSIVRWKAGKAGGGLPQTGNLEKLPLAYRTTPRDFYLGLGICLLDCALGTEEAKKLDRPDPYQDVISVLDRARALWQLSVENLDAPAETRERMRELRDAFVPAAEYLKLLILAFDEHLRRYPRVPFESLAAEARAAADGGDGEGQ